MIGCLPIAEGLIPSWTAFGRFCTLYGKFWITNGDENRFIRDNSIPKGWKLGRNMKKYYNKV